VRGTTALAGTGRHACRVAPDFPCCPALTSPRSGRRLWCRRPRGSRPLRVRLRGLHPPGRSRRNHPRAQPPGPGGQWPGGRPPPGL